MVASSSLLNNGNYGDRSVEDFTFSHPVRLSYSAESAVIQQCFSLTTNQRTVLSTTINQRNEQVEFFFTVVDDFLRVLPPPGSRQTFLEPFSSSLGVVHCRPSTHHHRGAGAFHTVVSDCCNPS
jgi:hypothetical protein